MLFIAYCDARTGNQISLWPLYVLPVCFVSWRFGFVEGAACAGGAAALLMVSAIFSGHPYSNGLYFLFATFSQLAALITIAWFASKLSAARSSLKKDPKLDDAA